MSPQQRAGEPAQPADDVYALGVLLHELLSGRPLFSADATGRRGRTEPPPAAGVVAPHTRAPARPWSRRCSRTTLPAIGPATWKRSKRPCGRSRVSWCPGPPSTSAGPGAPRSRPRGCPRWASSPARGSRVRRPAPPPRVATSAVAPSVRPAGDASRSVAVALPAQAAAPRRPRPRRPLRRPRPAPLGAVARAAASPPRAAAGSPSPPEAVTADAAAPRRPRREAPLPRPRPPRSRSRRPPVPTPARARGLDPAPAPPRRASAGSGSRPPKRAPSRGVRGGDVGGAGGPRRGGTGRRRGRRWLAPAALQPGSPSVADARRRIEEGERTAALAQQRDGRARYGGEGGLAPGPRRVRGGPEARPGGRVRPRGPRAGAPRREPPSPRSSTSTSPTRSASRPTRSRGRPSVLLQQAREIDAPGPRHRRQVAALEQALAQVRASGRGRAGVRRRDRGRGTQGRSPGHVHAQESSSCARAPTPWSARGAGTATCGGSWWSSPPGRPAAAGRALRGGDLSVTLHVEDGGRTSRRGRRTSRSPSAGPTPVLEIPGAPAPLAWLGLAEGEVFVQPATGVPVLCNGARLAASHWLRDGDVLRIGSTRSRPRCAPTACTSGSSSSPTSTPPSRRSSWCRRPRGSPRPEEDAPRARRSPHHLHPRIRRGGDAVGRPAARAPRACSCRRSWSARGAAGGLPRHRALRRGGDRARARPGRPRGLSPRGAPRLSLPGAARRVHPGGREGGVPPARGPRRDHRLVAADAGVHPRASARPPPRGHRRRRRARRSRWTASRSARRPSRRCPCRRESTTIVVQRRGLRRVPHHPRDRGPGRRAAARGRASSPTAPR